MRVNTSINKYSKKTFYFSIGIGICGEPCPRQCRICDKRIVQEIFFGSEDEPDARFVYLPDCRHISTY